MKRFFIAIFFLFIFSVESVNAATLGCMIGGDKNNCKDITIPEGCPKVDGIDCGTLSQAQIDQMNAAQAELQCKAQGGEIGEICSYTEKLQEVNTGIKESGLDVYTLKAEAKKLNPFKYSTGQAGVFQIVGKVINFIVGICGMISMMMYMYAGFLWMSAAGNSDNVSKAQSLVFWNTMAMILLLSSYMILRFVFDTILAGRTT